MSSSNQQPNQTENTSQNTRPTNVAQNVEAVNNENGVTKNIFSQPENRQIPNIFGKPANTTNIFSQNGRGNNNIFAAGRKSVNLFNVTTAPQQQRSNIFKAESQPTVKTLDEDDDNCSEQSSKLEKEQSQFKSKPLELVMKFKYENPWTTLKTYNIKKFKNGNSSSKQFVYLTLEKHSQNPNQIHIFVRTRQIKVFIFQGFFLKGVSDNISTFMKREDNLKFTVVKKVEQEEQNVKDQKPKFAKEQVKIQFETIKDANEFKQFIINEFASQTKTQTNSQDEKEKRESR